MEGLTRLVSESLARHGFDRPLDYRRLHWSRWFRCESPHSLLQVPSKSGVFALAEQVMDCGMGTPHVATAASAVQPARSAAEVVSASTMPKAKTPESRHMLAVTQFFEDDDMAFVLDRMMSRNNSMRARLTSGRYFVRFVVIEDEAQRQSICTALNQWIVGSAEKATGIATHFASSLELTAEQELHAHVGTAASAVQRPRSGAVPGTTADITSPATAPQLDSGAASNIHCPSPLPSGF